MAVTLLSFLLMAGWMVKRAFENNVNYTKIELDHYKSEREFSFFFISDIHRRILDLNWIKTIPSADAVIIGGDLIEKGVPFSRVEKNIQLLSKLGPVYFVYGNNDEEVDLKKLNQLLRANNVTILENKAIKLQIENDHGLWIAGVGDISYQKDDVQKTLQMVHTSDPIVLVSHEPVVIDKLAHVNKRIDLVLSGHTHGGQIRLFGAGPYENGSLKKVNSTYQLISNGFGTTFIPLRLGAKSETHHISLAPKNGSVV
ncbi:metallophosphoesterase [Jeotgalibacillus sp. ET6]|uniref:metallophosphoesterase n=1 Tax=Jeotgalibacillus sp. ET6 TaxID=3037260 RepID=UPI0024183509|nr:metallophosphoesterase [Jeotgalibacillus sp. ET6]MDG5470670.1 metallophosphoesterase [Jeotgalibacillus sp. ET6]